MKHLIIAALIALGTTAAQADTYTYCYPGHNLKVVVEANDARTAMIKAGRICYQALTRGTYPGEEAGMAIIDVCSNPRTCKAGGN